MRDFIELIAKQLVNAPDKVRVEPFSEETGSEQFILYVEPADRGKIIGRNGRTIKAFRIIIAAAAARSRRRASFEIYDDAPPIKRRQYQNKQ